MCYHHCCFELLASELYRSYLLVVCERAQSLGIAGSHSPVGNQPDGVGGDLSRVINLLGTLGDPVSHGFHLLNEPME